MEKSGLNYNAKKQISHLSLGKKIIFICNAIVYPLDACMALYQIYMHLV